MRGDRREAAHDAPAAGDGPVRAPAGRLGWLAALLIPLGHRPFYSKTAAALGLRPDDVLLDIACGAGEFLAEQAAHVERVTGVDISDIEVRLAQRRLRDRIAAGTAQVIHADAADLPLPDEAFTAINCVGAFLALDDPAPALAEMHRLLAPGGRAVVCLEMHGEDGKDHAHDEQRWHTPYYTEQQIHDLFTHAGFDRVDITYDGEAMLVKATKAGA